jgi:hypothetical protein
MASLRWFAYTWGAVLIRGDRRLRRRQAHQTRPARVVGTCCKLPRPSICSVVAGDAAGDHGRTGSLVAPTDAPAVALAQPLSQSHLTDNPVTEASIASYLGAGERVLALAQLGLWICLGLIVLVALTWAAGVLPGAVRLF